MYVVWVYVKSTSASKHHTSDNHKRPIKREFATKELYDIYMMALEDASNEVVEIISYQDGKETDRRPGNG